MVLLLDTCEFSVALDGDHGNDRISDILLRNLHSAFPLWHAFKITKLNAISSRIPIEFDVKGVITQPTRIETDARLPFLEFRNPCLKIWSVGLHNLS